jgi:hypothetical protein
MKTRFGNRIEAARVIDIPEYFSRPGDRFGAFCLMGPAGAELKILAAPGGDLPGELGAWEHVSVSTAKRAPNWREMCWVKDLFFDEEECVIQFHPPRSRYINCHPHCLHLWRPIDDHVRVPPALLVGPAGATERIQ